MSRRFTARSRSVARVYCRSRTVWTPQGNIALPPGITLISLIERNIANVGDSVAYRYLDYTRVGGRVAPSN